jgi:uncharacterized glyoxalase superfamily protein PhnB
VSAPLDLERTEMIDAVWFHLAAGGNVTMVSVLQCTINGKVLGSASDAVNLINSLV